MTLKDWDTPFGPSSEIGNTPADKDYQPSGVSREEQLCAACCPHYNKTPDQCGFTERKMQWDCPYFDFIERGYEQAEKDLALTWQDIREFKELINQVRNEYPNGIGAESFGEEVLRWFNEAKEDEK